MSKEHIINIPKLATKQLKLQKCKNGRKLVISTNWLPLFGFERDIKVIEELIDINKGLRIKIAKPTDTKQKKVYTREYKTRRNNPLETMLDIRSQVLLNKAFPENTVKVHIIFKQNEILITPITNKQLDAIEKFKDSDEKLSTFLACSSGVDAKLLEEDGFKIETLLEYRPHEKRDKEKDFSETGALNALNNIKPNYLINEDIMNLDLDKIASLTQANQNTFFHISLQCDDFSNAKSKSLKECSLDDNSSSIDMVLDALNIISKFNFPVVLIENVPQFSSSDIGKMTKVRLQRLGYKVYNKIYDARDYGGMTSRKRNYLVASLLPLEFKLPTKVTRNEEPIWSKLIEPLIKDNLLREISHSKSIQDGIKSGRARIIDRNSTCGPTFLKSQDRMAKDSVVIVDNIRNKIYFPSEELMQQLMSFSKDFNLTTCSKSIASEIIGQSVDCLLHSSLLKSIKEHILNASLVLKGRLF